MDELHQAVIDRLDRAGCRYTPSRRAVIEVLAGAGQPLTLPAILQRRPELAQSSAYRNLAELEAAGVVRRIITSEEHSHFELAEDLTGDHHHHLICVGCGTVRDFVVTAELEAMIDKAAAALARREGFAAESHRLDLVGRCERCKE